MLILGSSSPRRKEILSFFKLPFEQASPPFDESLEKFEGDPLTYAMNLAKGKALSLVEKFPDRPILTADTVVFQQGRLFCKPATPEEGFEMLKLFNGKWQTIFSAVVVARGKQLFTDYGETQVLFHHLTEEELAHYHTAFSGTDLAGGYGVQMGGSIIIKRIEGCFYNAVGLPLSAVRAVLAKVGINLWHYL